jgi:formate hydrogenlyase transcriptional activator
MPIVESLDQSGSQSWSYSDLAASPIPYTVDDHFLMALRTLTATLEVEGVCDAVLTGVENAFGAASSWIMLFDPRAQVLRTTRCRGAGAEVYRDVEIPPDCDLAGLAFSGGEIRFIADAAAEERWLNPDRVRQSGLRSVVLLPLIAQQEKLGVLCVNSPRFCSGTAPTPPDLKLFEVFAAQAAVGLLHARRYEASQQDRARLQALVGEPRSLRRQIVESTDVVCETYSFGPIIAHSDPMRGVLSELGHVVGSDVTVLLLGETGTGKELLARALHERSGRGRRDFVPVNCAAIPEHLIESELFGHERGAFTDAHVGKPGRFELAHRGTLFLDEVGDLPLNAQAKLLRVLQDGEVNRLGSTQPSKVDVRVVAATNQDLSARVASRVFRDDLFYRLSVFPIRIPPLRQRVDDIPGLVSHFVVRSTSRLGQRVTGIDAEVLELLMAYEWPGNVRELENVIERAVLLAAGGPITADSIRLDGVAAPSRVPRQRSLPGRPRERRRRSASRMLNGVRSSMPYAVPKVASVARAARPCCSGSNRRRCMPR